MTHAPKRNVDSHGTCWMASRLSLGANCFGQGGVNKPLLNLQGKWIIPNNLSSPLESFSKRRKEFRRHLMVAIGTRTSD